MLRNGRKEAWLRRLGGGLIAGGLAAAAYLGYQHVSPWQDNRQDEESTGIAADSIVLGYLLSGRPDFEICVDRVGDESLVRASDVAVVREALATALASSPYVPPAYAKKPAVLHEGCPKPAFLSDKRVSYGTRNDMRRSLVVGDSRGPKTMSPYTALVYFVVPETYRTAFGSEPYATSSEQYACQGDICGAVTRAVYLPADDIPQEGLAFGLREVLNLLSEQEAKDLLKEKLYP